jgi:hypothetical protein
VLSRPAEARARFLSDQCGQDKELRRDVEVLLAVTDQGSSLPDSSGRENPDPGGILENCPSMPSRWEITSDLMSLRLRWPEVAWARYFKPATKGLVA